MKATMNKASLNTAILIQAQANNILLSNSDIKPQGVSTNFRDAAGRIIRTKEGLIFKVRE